MPRHRSPAHRAPAAWRQSPAARWTLTAAAVVVLVAAIVLAVRARDSGGAPATAAPVVTDAPSSTDGNHTSSADTTTTTTSPVAPDAVFTLTAVGDTMLGKDGNGPPDGTAYFSAVHDALTSDAHVVFANLEGTLTDRTDGGKCAGSTSGNCFAFSVPPGYARGLAGAGFTVLNDANNHFFDFGEAGADDTVAAIHNAGMAQTGLPGEITVVQAGPVRVGFVAFAPYREVSDLLDVAGARALIAKAKTQSDVVVVYMHAGAEGTSAQHVTGDEETFLGEDRGNPQAFAHMAIDSGASLVIGSGPHVLRGIEVYNGHLVAYSLGNFAGYGNFSLGGLLSQSAILRVTLTARGELRAAQLVPTTFADKGRPILGGGGVATVARLSQDDFGATAANVAADGTITPP